MEKSYYMLKSRKNVKEWMGNLLSSEFIVLQTELCPASCLMRKRTKALSLSWRRTKGRKQKSFDGIFMCLRPTLTVGRDKNSTRVKWSCKTINLTHESKRNVIKCNPIEKRSCHKICFYFYWKVFSEYHKKPALGVSEGGGKLF